MLQKYAWPTAAVVLALVLAARIHHDVRTEVRHKARFTDRDSATTIEDAILTCD